ncbi:MAG: nodulation protein NfeD, partial [Chthoniobacterales bacterium]
MKSFIYSLLFFAGLAAAVPSVHAREEIRAGDVVVVPLQGEVSPPMFFFLRRILKEAETKNASAIILEMNTYGGRLDSAEEITNVLNRARIPTYTFINPNAGSAGALIALATQHIYMAPVSAIGAAAPIQSSGEDLGATARDKTISYWSALIRGSA